jgi:hypothetical protein
MSGYVEDGPRPTRRLALGATLGVAVVAAGGFLFFATGGDAEDDLVVPVTPVAAGAEVEAEGEPELSLESLPVVTYEVFLDRDPFEPVLEEDDGKAGGEGDPADTAGPDPEPAGLGAGLPVGTIIIDPNTGQAVVVQNTADFQASPGDGTAQAPAAPSDGCRGADEVICDGRVVTLVEVGTTDAGPRATVQVDDVIYEVAQGEVFGTSFRLLAIDGACVTLQYGDDTVRLCEGQRVLK